MHWEKINNKPYLYIHSEKPTRTKEQLDSVKRDILGIFSTEPFMFKEMTLPVMEGKSKVDVIYHFKDNRYRFYVRPKKPRSFCLMRPIVKEGEK